MENPNVEELLQSKDKEREREKKKNVRISEYSNNKDVHLLAIV